MKKKYMLPAFLAAMITVGANAQGRFDEMMILC